MKKSNQIEIKIRDISFISDWNTLLSMPLSVKEKLDPVSCTFFYTNRQGLQASIASKAMQRYSPMYYSICETMVLLCVQMLITHQGKRSHPVPLSANDNYF